MRRKERVTGNALDEVIQIISLAIVQNHLAIKIKRPSLEVLGAIAKMTPRTKLTMKLVSWLNRQMSLKIINKNKALKTKRDLLEKEILELNKKVKKLEKSKEIDITYGSTIKEHGSTIPRSVDPSSGEKVAEDVFSPPILSDFVITRKKLIHNKIEESKKPSLKPSLKSGLGQNRV
ncbi:hypothetical protein Tco_1430750 [Tanacetum coccineum]